MVIDHQAECNNRAGVPDHPEIFARWIREAAGYRAEASAHGWAELGLAYGPAPRQTIDLFSPANGAAAPLALFVHGRYWRSLEPSHFTVLDLLPDPAGPVADRLAVLCERTRG